MGVLEPCREIRMILILISRPPSLGLFLDVSDWRRRF